MTIFNDSFYNAMAECMLNSVAAAVTCTSVACVRRIASYVSIVLRISYMRSYMNNLQF